MLLDRFPTRPVLRHVTVQQGLVQDVVNAVAEDRVGFLWFGTEKGLARYDGLRFETFRPAPDDPGSLSSEAVTSLLVDSAGALWVGTWGGGLNRLDRATDTFTHIRSRTGDPAALRDDRVLTLFEDRTGTLWVGTASGLDRVDRTTLRVTHFEPASSSRTERQRAVWAVCEDLFETLWVGTSAGLLRLDRQSGLLVEGGRPVLAGQALPSGRVRALATDRLGRLWVASSRGLMVLDREHGFLPPSAVTAAAAPLDDAAGSTLFTDHSGTLWVGTTTAGLFGLDLGSGRVEHISHDPHFPGSLGHDDVHGLFEDHSGVLWIATHGAGVDRLDLKPAKFVNVANDIRDERSIPPGRVWCFLEDGRGVLWVGTDRGLTRFDPGERRFAGVSLAGPRWPGLPDGPVTRLSPGDREEVWAVVRPDWLVRLGPDGQVVRAARLSLPEPGARDEGGILDLHPLAGGTVLVGTGRGLLAFDSVTGSLSATVDPTGGAAVTAVLVDSSGRFWIGTDGRGLLRCTSPSGTCLPLEHQPSSPGSLSHGRVWSLHEDPRGTVWVGTASGLNRFEPASGTFTRFQAREGFPSDNVYAIQSDTSGRLWLSTDRGLTRFDPASGTFRTFTPSDGLQANLATPGACSRTRDGTVLFGGFDGFSAFDPSRVQPNPNVPRVVIRSFARPHREVRFARPLHELGEIRLAHFENFFSIGFAALDYTDPSRNLYRYRLEGFEPEWVQVAAGTPATYTNVPPGRYLFHVVGSNNDGMWNETGATLPVIITPPVWSTWWFQTVAGLGLAGLGIAAYRARIRHLEGERRKLELLVAERTSELAQSRDLLAEHRDQLQQINEIVKVINAPHDFTELLSSLLAQMRIIRCVDKAAALIWDREASVFRFRAAWGWSMEDLDFIEMTADEARERYERQAEEICPDIFVARNTGRNPAEEKFTRPRQWKAMLILRIRVGERVEGYLILDSTRDESAFAEQDVLLLDSLREHIRSAFIKAQTLAELQALNAKKNEFLGMAAHDLRGPLGLIGAWAGMTLRQIQSGSLQPEKGIRDLGRVVTQAEQMNRLVSELLDISAIESGKVQIRPRAEDLRGLIGECEHLFGRLAAEKRISLTVLRDEGPAPVQADRDRVLEVLSNLVSNAVKFTPPGGAVRVWCEQGSDGFVAHVEDTGPGLSDEDLTAVFRRFGKLSARPTGGEPSTGLGLAIVKKLVELHGGRVWATSRPGHGARFSFSLPAPPPTQ
ncbi:MAG: two-component regulator propeller domain-containing protein [Thermoanaerobaculaceae bacterium]